MRQNYLTRESFVPFTEEQVRQSLSSVPAFAAHMQFLTENRYTESMCFRYTAPLSDLRFRIDVTILPLNETYTRISLHGTFETGQTLRAQREAAELALALYDFERAAEAAIRGDATAYESPRPPSGRLRQVVLQLGAFLTAAAFLVLGKRLS